MDILTHTLSGVAVAGAVAALSSKPLGKKALVLCCGAVGALLPDVDAVTLWSRFDTVIGQRLHLTASGRNIYFGDQWYSHHNLTHSLAAGAIITLLMGLLFYLANRLRPRGLSISAFLKHCRGYLLAFFLGYTLHLLGDLPTPGHTWHGIKLFWPLANPIGGTGHIWWWNNYDIFILLVLCCTATAVVMVIDRMLKSRYRVLKYLPTMILVVTLWSTLYQITHRPMRFTYNQHRSNHAENEKHSLAVQKKILGEPLYGVMVSLDRQLKIYF